MFKNTCTVTQKSLNNFLEHVCLSSCLTVKMTGILLVNADWFDISIPDLMLYNCRLKNI